MNKRNKPHNKNETIVEEEEEEENDTLVELKNFKNLNIQSRRPLRKIKASIQEVPKHATDDDNETNDDIEEAEEPVGKPRVERFLSICEIPPEILMYQQEMQRKFGGGGGVGQERRTDNDAPKKIPGKKNRFAAKKNDFEKIDKTKSFSTKFGNGLSQQVRAEIIRNIIRNFNLENYINQFKSDYVIEIELDKKYFEVKTKRLTQKNFTEFSRIEI
jgi:hypothetical protein